MASPLSQSRRGFSIESLRFPLAALGIFGLLAGLGAWLVQGDFGLVPRILIAAGVLFIVIYVALDPEERKGRERLNPSARRATVMPVAHNGVRFSWPRAICRQPRALVALTSRLQLSLADFAVASICFARRRDARVLYSGC